MLLHEEVRLARIDRVLEVLNVIKDDDAGVGFVGVGELALLVGKDEGGFNELADDHLGKRTGVDGLTIDVPRGCRQQKQGNGQKARDMIH